MVLLFGGTSPDSKVHGAYMGPIWGRQDPGGPHVGPMNCVIWGSVLRKHSQLLSKITLWCYDMATLSTLLALCVGNPTATDVFPHKAPVIQSFDGFFVVNLCLVHTKLICNTSLHVPTQITERVKTGSFDQMFCIIRYQYVSKQFSVCQSHLYSVRSPLVSSSPHGDDISKQSKSVCSALEPVQTQLYLIPTASNSVLTSSKLDHPVS